MLKVLINAYACSPDMGSEPGMAWNWCVNLARYCELHIITEGEFEEKIKNALLTLPQAENMHFYYLPVTEEVRKMCWNQGDWRFYSHYRKWQMRAYETALTILKEVKIDIVHQLNMIGFREPGFLWKIKGVPFVWGPIDAKEKFPVSYLKGARIHQQLFFRLKNYITSLQLKYSKRVRKAIRSASFVISASADARTSLKKFFNIDSPLLNETGCYVTEHPLSQKVKDDSTFHVLWVGKMDFRKQLDLALRSVAAAKIENLKLHIVGGGDQIPYRKLAESLNIEDHCVWHGLINRTDVQDLMSKCHLLFFTSVAEGTPHVVLEAIGNCLPVLCFNTCGQGDAVNLNVGMKIELSHPERSVKEFSKKLIFLESNRDELYRLSHNCLARQQELSWESKILTLLELYKRSLSQKDSVVPVVA